MEQQHCPLSGETERPRPPGFNFTPNDKQLIDPYLRHYAHTGKSCWDHIVEERVYEKEPSELLGDDCDKRYFFTTRTKRTPTKHTPTPTRTCYNRTVGHDGRWVSKGQKDAIKSSAGDIIGYMTPLYYQKLDGTKTNTGYIMREYELHPSVPSSSSDKEERVLCCVKMSSKKRKAETAADAKAASKQAHHENGGGRGAIDKSRADIVIAPESVSPANAAVAIGVTAGNWSAGPSQISNAYCSATQLPMQSFSAAEALPERGAHTEPTNFVSGNQIMPSSAADQQLLPCSSSCSTEDILNVVNMLNLDIIYSPEQTYSHNNFFDDLASIGQHHSGQPSGQDGDQLTASDQERPTFLNKGYSPQPPAPE